jgi:acyl carrier protein
MSSEELNVRSTVREFVIREFLLDEDPANLTDDAPLITSGIMDSIGTIRLVSHLEQEFGITLEQRDITVQHFNSVNDIVATVSRKILGQ